MKILEQIASLMILLKKYKNWNCYDLCYSYYGNSNRFYDSRIYSFSGTLISSGELGVNNFFFLAAMMLAYQPIRSLATLNMVAYQGAAAFKRIAEVIDKNILVKENEQLPELKIRNSDIKFENINFKYDSTKKKP